MARLSFRCDYAFRTRNVAQFCWHKHKKRNLQFTGTGLIFICIQISAWIFNAHRARPTAKITQHGFFSICIFTFRIRDMISVCVWPLVLLIQIVFLFSSLTRLVHQQRTLWCMFMLNHECRSWFFHSPGFITLSLCLSLRVCTVHSYSQNGVTCGCWACAAPCVCSVCLDIIIKVTRRWHGYDVLIQ